jgi:hypothetical protein
MFTFVFLFDVCVAASQLSILTTVRLRGLLLFSRLQSEITRNQLGSAMGNDVGKAPRKSPVSVGLGSTAETELTGASSL